MFTQNNITSENQQIVAKLHGQIPLQSTRNSLKPIIGIAEDLVGRG
jgi:hypothetical protein